MYYKITTKDEIVYGRTFNESLGSEEFEVKKIWQKNSDVIFFKDVDYNIVIIPKTEIKKIEIMK